MKNIFYTLFFIPAFLFCQNSHTLFFDGLNREYLVYVPETYDGSEEYPVLFNFHGGNGTSEGQIAISDMRNLADENNFPETIPGSRR